MVGFAQGYPPYKKTTSNVTGLHGGFQAGFIDFLQIPQIKKLPALAQARLYPTKVDKMLKSFCPLNVSGLSAISSIIVF